MKELSPSPGTDVSRPRTRAGWQLRSQLVGPPEQSAGGPLGRLSASFARLPVSRDYGTIAVATLTILTRRRFTTRPDTEIHQYAQDVALRCGGRRASDELTRAVAAVVEEGTGRKPAPAGIGWYRRGKVQLMLLRDLTREMTPEEVNEIIAFAEISRAREPAGKRTRAGRPRRSAQRRARRLGYAETGKSTASGTGGTQAGPTTRVGQQIMALFTYDKRGSAYEMSDPRDDDVAAVVDCLFELAVRRRFRTDWHPEELTQFVNSIAERSANGLPVPFVTAEAIVGAELGGSALKAGEVDRPFAFIFKLSASRSAVSDLGLLDRERSELLVEAEHRARERGFNPTPAPPREKRAE